MAPQRLERIKSAPGNGMGSEASNPQDVVHGRAADRALRPTKKWGGLGERKGGALPRRPTSDCWIVFFSVNDNILSVKDKSCYLVTCRAIRSRELHALRCGRPHPADEQNVLPIGRLGEAMVVARSSGHAIFSPLGQRRAPASERKRLRLGGALGPRAARSDSAGSSTHAA